MLHIYLGPDTYSKHNLLEKRASEKAVNLTYAQEANNISVLSLIETDLFTKHKIFALNSLPGDLFFGNNLQKVINSKNTIVVLLNSLDKRKKENKDLLSNSEVIFKEFTLPHGAELNKRVAQIFKEKRVEADPDAIEELVVRLGRDNYKETRVGGKVIAVEERYSMWAVVSEIEKLVSFCENSKVTLKDVLSLVSETTEADALSIINDIAEKKRPQVFTQIDRLIKDTSAADEKVGVIQLNALLAEQFRSIYLVQNLMEQNLNENEMLEVLGWKPGRLFMVKKNANKFKPEKVIDTLSKLALLDEELKTSTTSGRLILELVLSQII